MGAPDTAQGPAAVRFAPYIEELREFFASAGLRYGSPEDIIPITDRIESSQSFADDLSSMVRSIVLRESGEMPHSQLLEILAIAIGGEKGEETDEVPQEYDQPLRNLLSFLTGVLRKPWNEPPPEPVRPVHTGHERGEILEFPTGPRYLGLRSHGQAAAISAAAERAARAAARFDDGVRNTPASGHGRLEPVEHQTFQHDRTAEPGHDPRRQVPGEDPRRQGEDPRIQRRTPDLVGEPTPPQRSMFDPQTPADEAIEEPNFGERDTEDPNARAAATLSFPIMHSISALRPNPAVRSASAHPPALPVAPIVTEAAADVPSWQVAADAVRGVKHAPQPEVSLSPPPVETTRPSVRSAEPVQQASIETDPTALALAATGALPFQQSSPAPPLTGSTKAPASKRPDSLAALPPYKLHAPRTAAGMLVAAAALLVLAGVFSASFHRVTELTGKQPEQASPSTLSGTTAQSVGTAHPQPALATAAAAPASSAPAPKLPRIRRVSTDDDADEADVAPPYSTPIAGQPAVVKPSAYGAQTQQTAAPVIRNSRPPANEIASTSSQPPGSVAVGRENPAESYAGGHSGLYPGVGSGYRSSEAAAGDVPPSGRGSREVAGDSDTIEVSSGLMAGYLISSPKPDYPGLAHIAHIGGPVVLQAVIAKNGSVLATHVLSGHRLLRGAAQDAVRRWRFRPYYMDGHPVEVSTIVTVRFNPKH